MLSFPNCKINLGLNIIRKRDDGYHDLETVFYPLDLKDILEINQTFDTSPISDSFLEQSGLKINGSADQNLVLKAWHLLKKDYPALSPVRMHLHKNIPMGAGLGGGSSDGAFALRMLNQLYELNLPDSKLIEYAAQLGSDCPFFIFNKPCWATSRGEVLEPIPLNMESYSFAVVHPGLHISTAEAFRSIRPSTPKKSIRQIVREPVETWREQLRNDFEPGIFLLHPQLPTIKQALYDAGAIYSSMTGSGSSIYGIFPKMDKLHLPISKDYRIDILL